MNTKQINQLKQSLRVLNGLPLRKITRAADTICLQFGDLVEKKGLVRGDDGKLAVGQNQVGAYALQAQCCLRIYCGDEIIAAKSDLYQISINVAASIPDGSSIPDDFDYDIVGNNRLDEVLTTAFNDLCGFEVESVKISMFGDIFIKFSNKFGLDVIMDVSGAQECWRFFKQGDDRHLVVTGQGLADGD